MFKQTNAANKPCVYLEQKIERRRKSKSLQVPSASFKNPSARALADVNVALLLRCGLRVLVLLRLLRSRLLIAQLRAGHNVVDAQDH